MAMNDKQAQALIDAATGANETVDTEGAVVVDAGAQAAGVETKAQDGDESSLYDWSDTFADEPEPKKVEEVEKVEEKTETTESEWWQKAAEKLGVEASDEADFLEKAKPREVYVDEKDPSIRKLKGYVSMDDESLVKEDKKARGWSEDKITRYLEKNKDNLEFEAEDIRATLNAEINNYSRQKQKAALEAQTQQRAVRDKMNQEVEGYLSKTDELLGFKVGRDEASTTKWRQGMGTYLKSGGIFKDIDAIVKDATEGKPEKLVELAQFLKGRDGILKGLMQKGKSQEAKKFLQELENSGDEAKKGERVGTDKAKNLDAWVV